MLSDIGRKTVRTWHCAGLLKVAILLTLLGGLFTQLV